MNAEFPSICRELIQDAEEKLNKQVGLKVKLIRNCEYEIARNSNDIKDKLSAMFMTGLHKNFQDLDTTGGIYVEPTTPIHSLSLNKQKTNYQVAKSHQSKRESLLLTSLNNVVVIPGESNYVKNQKSQMAEEAINNAV